MFSQIIVSGFRKVNTAIDAPEIKLSLEACVSAEITGISLCSDGVFLNVMEGNDAQTLAILNAFQKDKRFSEVHTMMTKRIQTREFDDYRIGVTGIELPETLLKAFDLKSDSYKTHLPVNASTDIITLIKAFARVNALS